MKRRNLLKEGIEKNGEDLIIVRQLPFREKILFEKK